MAKVSKPFARPSGRALIVGGGAGRDQPAAMLQKIGYGCVEADDPYSAMAELCHRPMAYQAVVLSLRSLYREELEVVAAIKRRFPHIEVWLSDTDGRSAALAEAVRIGADGLLGADGLHPMAPSAEKTLPTRSASVADNGPIAGPAPVVDESAQRERRWPQAPERPVAQPGPVDAAPHVDERFDLNESEDEDGMAGGAVLTAEELRALLQEQPSPYGSD